MPRPTFRARTILPHGLFLACCLIPAAAGRQTSAQGQIGIQTLTPEQREILGHLSIVYQDDGQGGTVKTIRLSEANFQIVNGLEATNGNLASAYTTDPLATATNGLGNLIIGYNEMPQFTTTDRTGSHNIVGGLGNGFSSFGGIVGSSSNTISGPLASVTGGTGNTASGVSSSVSAGQANMAQGFASSVSAGQANMAQGFASSVSGGFDNEAQGDGSSVSGGGDNWAQGAGSSVSGGSTHTAVGDGSSISGGASITVLPNLGWAAGTLTFP